jgi:hypothetical protein
LGRILPIGILPLAHVGQVRGEQLVDDAIESRNVEGGDDRLTKWVKRCEGEPRGLVFSTGVRGVS